MIQGHSSLVNYLLTHSLPPVVLLKGPDSVGKRTIVEHVLKELAPSYDTLHIKRLTAQAAREARAFAWTSPFGDLKYIGIDLDNAPDSVLNSMLKTFEEPSRFVRFILYASQPVIPTVESRAEVHQVGLLSPYLVSTILVEKLGIAPDVAKRAANLSGGRVSKALASMDGESSKMAVLNVINSIASDDLDLYNASVARWSQEDHSVLSAWLSEALTGQWAMFSEEESRGLNKDRRLLMRMLRIMGSDARPKFVMKTAGPSLIAAQ